MGSADQASIWEERRDRQLLRPAWQAQRRKKNPSFKATLLFIDKDVKSLAHLKGLAAINNQHPNVTIAIKEGVFTEQVDNVIAELRRHPNSPTFSFIDPFGFGQSPLDKLKLLMHNQSSELFVNFFCGFMNRFKEHDDPEVTGKIKNMVGQDDLGPIIRADDSIDAICFAFEGSLKKLGRYTLKFMMRDEHNIRDNAFFFCGRNPKGFEKIKEAMWKVDPVHGNSFSAHQELSRQQAQANLFTIGPQSHRLSALLMHRFKGRRDVRVEEIFKWVVEETDTYLEPHARTQLERLLDRGLITSVTDPSGSTRKRRKNDWPTRLLVSFAAQTPA
jgi:three-Cys-motif partner protein